MNPEQVTARHKTIFDAMRHRLEHEAGEIRHEAAHLLHPHRPTGDDHPAAYDEKQPITSTKGDLLTSIVTDATTALRDTTANMRGWIDDFEQKVPAIFASLGKVEQSPIFQALLGLGEATLPAELEQSIVGLISMGVKMGTGAAAAVTPGTVAQGTTVTAGTPAAAVTAPSQQPAAPAAG